MFSQLYSYPKISFSDYSQLRICAYTLIVSPTTSIQINFTWHYYSVKHPFSIPCKPDLQSFTLNNLIANFAASPSIPIQKINDLCDTSCWTCQVSGTVRCDCNQMLRHLKVVLPLGSLIHADLFWFLETEHYHAAGTGAKKQKFFQCLSLGDLPMICYWTLYRNLYEAQWIIHKAFVCINVLTWLDSQVTRMS